MQRFQRYDDQGWFKVGTLEVTTSVFLAAAAAISVILGVASAAIFRDPLFYDAQEVRAGEVWRVATYPLSNGVSIFILLSIAMMVMVGGEIERELRRRQFAWFMGAIIVLPALVTVGFDYVGAAGLGRLVSPLFVVYVLWRPTARTFFEIPLWVLVVAFEVFDLLQILDIRNTAPGVSIVGLLVFWAASLAVAALGARAFGITEFTQIPKIPLPQFVTGDPYTKANRARVKQQRNQAKGKGSGGGAKSGGGLRRASKEPAPVIPIRPEARLDRAEQADMDWLLDKISESGMGSLTPDEKQRLDEHSRRLRGQ